MRKLEGIYIIEFERGFKLGRTSNFNSRLRCYTDPWSQGIVKIWFMKTVNSKIIERKIKQLYNTRRYQNAAEFFSKIWLEGMLKAIASHSRCREQGKILYTGSFEEDITLIYNKELKLNLYNLKIKY